MLRAFNVQGPTRFEVHEKESHPILIHVLNSFLTSPMIRGKHIGCVRLAAIFQKTYQSISSAGDTLGARKTFGIPAQFSGEAKLLWLSTMCNSICDASSYCCSRNPLYNTITSSFNATTNFAQALVLVPPIDALTMPPLRAVAHPKITSSSLSASTPKSKSRDASEAFRQKRS